MRSQSGASAIVWIIGVVVLAVIITFAIQFLGVEVDKKAGEDIKTEMLQVQAKAKVILEKYHVNNNNGLKGEKMQDASLEETFGITDIGNFYKWTISTLKEVGLSEPVLKEEEYYLVNYDTEEVVYSSGYRTEDDSVYFKLTDLKNM